jgi:glycosyltransferase involved in cell wall biosynthesis
MISVCIATYNGEKYITEQIDSILSQLDTIDELIVSDDASIDGTLEIITAYKDNRIRIIHNKKRKGVIKNFENALFQVKGDYIFLSDQDDIWLPGKVFKILKQMDFADLVFSNAMIVDENLNELGLMYKETKGVWIIKNLIKNNFIGATMAVKKDFLKQALPFPSYIPMHDQWLGLLATCIGKVIYIAEPLILYRRHNNNTSFTGEKSKYNLLKKIKFRIQIILALFMRLILLLLNNMIVIL